MRNSDWSSCSVSRSTTSGTARSYGLPIRHSVGTTLAYSPAFGACAWALADALVATDWVAAVIAGVTALVVGVRYYTIDP